MKTIAIYGDSISTGTHGEGGYEAMLKSSLSLEKVYNFAVGSSGLTRKTPGGMLTGTGEAGWKSSPMG